MARRKSQPLMKCFPQNPFVTLLDEERAVHGSATALVLGPLPEGPCISTSLHRTLPASPPRLNPTDRDVFGSTAYINFLRQDSDAFEIIHHTVLWAGKVTCELYIHYIFNGLDGFKHVELISFISSASVDCLVLVDARISRRQSRYLL